MKKNNITKMTVNLYTMLAELYYNRDTELFRIINDYKRGQSCNSSQQVLSDFSCYLSSTRTVGQDEARQIIKDILFEIGNPDLDYYQKIAGLKAKLQPEGIARLLYLLYQRNKNDDEIADEFINVTDSLQQLFTGAPIFSIVVVDERPNYRKGDAYKKIDGRYDVYLTKKSTNERYKIQFPTSDSKVIFIWFLQHPCQEFYLYQLKEKRQEFIDLYNKCFYGEADEKLCKKLNNNEKDNKNRDGFDNFWLNGKPKANASIKSAIGERDMEDFYIIRSDSSDNNKVSISLPHTSIKLPNSLMIW